MTLAGSTTAYGIDNPAPSPVDGLVSSNVTSTGFDLSWSTAPHAVSYDVKVGNVLTSQTGTTASFTGLASSTSVLVQVRARNSAGVSAWEYLLVTTSAATPPPTTTAAVAVSPRTTVYGTKVLVAGVLRTNRVGTGAAVVTVSVRIGTRWYSLGRATTATNGTWRLPVRATFPTATLRATAAGFPTVTTTLKVASAPVASVRGRTVRVTVAPNLTGRPVILQVRSGGAWRTVLRTLLRTGSTRTFTARRAGTYRIVVPATNGYLAGVSAKITVR